MAFSFPEISLSSSQISSPLSVLYFFHPVRTMFSVWVQLGRQRLSDKEPEAHKGKVTCLKLYVKPVTSLQLLRNHAQNEKFRQVEARASSQPEFVGWGREWIKGTAVQILMVLISGIITLPSAAHTQRPGVSDGISQCHFLYEFPNPGGHLPKYRTDKWYIHRCSGKVVVGSCS